MSLYHQLPIALVRVFIADIIIVRKKPASNAKILIADPHISLPSAVSLESVEADAFRTISKHENNQMKISIRPFYSSWSRTPKTPNIPNFDDIGNPGVKTPETPKALQIGGFGSLRSLDSGIANVIKIWDIGSLGSPGP